MNFFSGLPLKSFFLRLLSLCYSIGALIHLADLLDLNLKFSEMTGIWKLWTIYLLVADSLASVGLWRQTLTGIVLFQVIAFSQLVVYSCFKAFFGNQNFLIGFHLITLAIFYILTLSKQKIEREVTR